MNAVPHCGQHSPDGELAGDEAVTSSDFDAGQVLDDVLHSPDGVGGDDRELDLQFHEVNGHEVNGHEVNGHEVNEDVLGVELAVSAAAGHPGGRFVDVVDVEHSAASAHSVVA